MDEATARPWAAFQTGSEGCSIVARDIRAPRVARLTSADLPTCKADAALIVEAVNAYDRLRAIEAAARAYVVDHPNWLVPEEDGCPTSEALRAALSSEAPSDAPKGA